MHRTLAHYLISLVFTVLLLLGLSQCASSSGKVAVQNKTDAATTVFVSFGGGSAITGWPFCKTVPSGCSFPLPAHRTVGLPLGGKYLNATFAFGSAPACGQTVLEVNVNTSNQTDTANISLVNGYSTPVSMTVVDSSGTHVLGPVHAATGNEKAFGVYPLGCDICIARSSPPCGIAPGNTGCKRGPDQYHPDVPCQYQGSSGESVLLSLLQ
jgi:hypothetical protein